MKQRRATLGLALGAVVALLLFLLARSVEQGRPPPTTSPQSTAIVEPGPRFGPIEVRVLRGDVPVADADLALLQTELGQEHVRGRLRTDSRGVATFGPTAPGHYELSVAHPEHVTRRQSLDHASGGSTLVIELVQGARLELLVVEAAGRAVPGASVRLLGVGTEHERPLGETDAQGRRFANDLEIGAYRVLVHTGRHRPKTSEPVELRQHGRSVSLKLVLEPGRVLAGRVLGDDGVPIAGARVGSSDEGSLLATTDESGEFELGGLGDLPISVFATAVGYAPRHLRGLRPGGRNLELVLERPASVQGQVELAAPATALLVSVCHHDPALAKEICLARRSYQPPEPTFRIDGLPSGTYDVVLEADGHAQARERVILRPGQDASAGSIRLTRAP